MPVELSQLTRMQYLDAFNNSLSGSIPNQLASLTRMQFLILYSNWLSGSIPHQFSSMTSLRHLLLIANWISGSIPRQLSSLSQLQNLFLSYNLLSGSIPSELGSLSVLNFLGLAHNSLTGSVPPELSKLTALSKLLLNQNTLSGTLASHGLASSATTLSLSNNGISGTIPISVASMTALRVLLANDMALSGTLPTFNDNSLVTLSLSRNYLVGGLVSLQNQSRLATLVLSSNHLSCEAPSLDNAALLGQGQFHDPQTQAQVDSFQAVSEYLFGSDPKETPGELVTYRQTVLAFAGNVQLVQDSSAFLGDAPGRLLEQDRVRQGRQRLFRGYSSFKEAVWLLLPGLCVLHLITVWLIVRKVHKESLVGYLMRSMARSKQAQSVLLQESAVAVCGLGACGVGLVCINVLAPTVYSPGCSDPLVRGTISGVSVQVCVWYQWAWVCSTCGVLLIATRMWERLYRQDGKAQATEVLVILQRVADLLSCPELRAVNAWRDKLNLHGVHRQQPWWRRCVYYLLHLPVFALASIPAFGFVLSKNVSDNGWFVTVFGSSTFVAVLKVALSSLVLPVVADRLSRFKYRVGDLSSAAPELNLRVFNTQVITSILFELVVVLLSPVLFVFLLDESCLRYYLDFDNNLLKLLEAWEIAERGWHAYRTGFCSRRLLAEFTYVWLVYLLLRGLLTPTKQLAKSHPAFQRLVRRLNAYVRPSSVSQNEYMHTLEEASSAQQALAKVITMITIATGFGVLVPWLLMLLPLLAWLGSCSLDLLDRHPNPDSCTRSTRWLVQVPVGHSAFYVHVSMWTVTYLVFLDLDFGVGPVLFYTGFVLLQLVWFGFRYRARGKEARSLQRATAVDMVAVQMRPTPCLHTHTNDRVPMSFSEDWTQFQKPLLN
eukprot:TRINITY_DN4032_c0_g1_i6.p1 TRINITY_DN4032_c0_g1~~TRINITY_DN4032_c0_g1_i6.p1  ORF type:complete len:887 (+),score=95.56 TRINITY_DN4032_c0_g1_i6:717-3377(+)